MEIIEERTIGPSLGAENIAKGFNSVIWGFLVIVAFMCLYYMVFGLFSSIALGVNLLLLVAVLSMLQATLTLPGMAAMALALGMAIDSNVLINERVREELRLGASPQAAIHAGYDRAWATIFDSNITTLIAGVALLAFGSGPVRGFAVVHCLGILTSMFSAVFFSRGLVNLWYGRQKKLKTVSIGTVWRPDGSARLQQPTKKHKAEQHHGIFQNPQRHPVHEECVDFQRYLLGHLLVGSVLFVQPWFAFVGGIHGRHCDGSQLQPARRPQPGAWRGFKLGLHRCASAKLWHSPRRDDSFACTKGCELCAAKRQAHEALKAQNAEATMRRTEFVGPQVGEELARTA
jgi:preprotein translocase subunit SecF